MKVKITPGFVATTPRGVFLGGTEAELSQEEIDAQPLGAITVIDAAPKLAFSRDADE